MSKKAARIEKEQDPFNVGQIRWVCVNVIVIEDSIDDVHNYCNNTLKLGGTWKDGTNGGGKGSVWLESKNKFIAPQPYASWSLNNSTDIWEAPITKPANPTFSHTEGEEVDTYLMTWNETDQRWEGLNRENNNNYYWNPTDSSWNLIT
mgnify:CR=1 FL=1